MDEERALRWRPIRDRYGTRAITPAERDRKDHEAVVPRLMARESFTRAIAHGGCPSVSISPLLRQRGLSCCSLWRRKRAPPSVAPERVAPRSAAGRGPPANSQCGKCVSERRRLGGSKKARTLPPESSHGSTKARARSGSRWKSPTRTAKIKSKRRSPRSSPRAQPPGTLPSPARRTRLAPGGRLDHRRGPVDRRQSAAVEPLAHHRGGDPMAATDLDRSRGRMPSSSRRPAAAR
jgi:hypothetical protein